MTKPEPEVSQNTWEFLRDAMITPTGFREYDARWWFGHPASDNPPELNLMGVQALGMGLGTLIQELGAGPDIVTYSYIRFHEGYHGLHYDCPWTKKNEKKKRTVHRTCPNNVGDGP